MADENTQNVETTENTQSTSESGAELTVQDLNAIKQIIDVASQRGAFRPNEMMTIGQTYNKLETFLSAVSSQQGES